MRNKGKTYYVCYKKENEEVIISFTLQEVADFLHLHRNTIRKYISNNDKYSSEGFIIWRNIGINKVKTGFALKKPKYIP